VHGGVIEEFIDAFGTRAWRIDLTDNEVDGDGPRIRPDNLVLNPSWEDNPSVGTPAGCYASVGPGATFFIDSRLSVHGEHSARLIVPDEESHLNFRPFPFRVETNHSYRISVWAKAREADTQLTVMMGGFGSRTFDLTTEWAEYTLTVTPDSDERRSGLRLELSTPGCVWLDLLQVVEIETE
jgi:hypothetical protein